MYLHVHVYNITNNHTFININNIWPRVTTYPHSQLSSPNIGPTIGPTSAADVSPTLFMSF